MFGYKITQVLILAESNKSGPVSAQTMSYQEKTIKNPVVAGGPRRSSNNYHREESRLDGDRKWSKTISAYLENTSDPKPIVWEF